MPLQAILDCDPGHDDAMAILLGARTLELKGITTVHGNAPLSLTTLNARKILTLAEIANIPVAAGFDRPMLRQPVNAPQVHGESGLDGPELPQPAVDVLPEHAITLIDRMAQTVDDLHLIPVGPLTNVAMALQHHPQLASRITQITLMGGSLTTGNVTAAAEFNIWADPEAAHVVFQSGVPIKMVGLNVTRQVAATPERRQQIRRMGSRTAQAVAGLLDFYSERLQKLLGLSGGSMHDPLAVATLVAPEILRFEPMHVAVELHGQHTYGMTLCDYRQYDALNAARGGWGDSSRESETNITALGAAPNAEVAVAVNEALFWELFLDVLSTYP